MDIIKRDGSSPTATGGPHETKCSKLNAGPSRLGTTRLWRCCLREVREVSGGATKVDIDFVFFVCSQAAHSRPCQSPVNDQVVMISSTRTGARRGCSEKGGGISRCSRFRLARATPQKFRPARRTFSGFTRGTVHFVVRGVIQHTLLRAYQTALDARWGDLVGRVAVRGHRGRRAGKDDSVSSLLRTKWPYDPPNRARARGSP